MEEDRKTWVKRKDGETLFANATEGYIDSAPFMQHGEWEAFVTTSHPHEGFNNTQNIPLNELEMIRE